MPNDRLLTDVVPPAIAEKLANAAIRTVRQFYARLRNERGELQNYLDLSDATFAELKSNIEGIVRSEFPEDLNANKEHPRVGRGVAAHRL